ncbi:hypothetical protein Poli38472_007169 [Pythium oligandrum]|uniref:Radial spoke head 10 family protein n=1 Tax=Pythium oligandrum TaxID=41045 RepID=A0A8K1FFI7_PYTOL|nr:hypothetical protein Poli38472_007169 [Pythium oligandrum]|eukprot:TMW59024.1 hypothetical protein Poli38472_007169 [Pythium oligandrum]
MERMDGERDYASSTEDSDAPKTPMDEVVPSLSTDEAAAPQPASFKSKPPLDPRILGNVILEYTGDTTRVRECDVPVYHGQGRAVFLTGFAYTGEFQYGRMHGHGRIEWTNGVTYDGAFVDNEIQGHGTYTWPNGSSYVGDVVRGRRHGVGVFLTGSQGVVSLPSEDAEDAVMLPFSFSEDAEELVTATSNARYEGEWQDGLPHGHGVLVFDNDRHVRYEGAFVKGYRHGHGVMRYASGNMYTGEWHENVKSGYGTMIWLRSDGVAVEKYVGLWREDRPNGVGRHVWLVSTREKNWYDGAFQSGLRHGRGIFYYANGARYEGEWRENVKHGNGVFLYEDGRVFKGRFQDDRAMDANGAPASPTHALSTSHKLLLFIDDVLPTEASAREKARKATENAALRLNTELRALYRHAIQGQGEEEATLLLVDECRRLLLEGGIVASAGLLERTLAELRDAQRMQCGVDWTANVSSTHPEPLPIALPDVVEPGRVLVFREFVEMLVRLAWQQQILETTAALPKDLTEALAERFVGLFERIAHPKAGDPKPDDALNVLVVNARALQDIYYKHDVTLRKLFSAPPAPEDEQEGKMTLRAVLAILREHDREISDVNQRMFSASFRLVDALRAVQPMFPSTMDEPDEPQHQHHHHHHHDSLDPFLLDLELVFADVLDVLTLLVHAKTHQNESEIPLMAAVDAMLHRLAGS